MLTYVAGEESTALENSTVFRLGEVVSRHGLRVNHCGCDYSIFDEIADEMVPYVNVL